jgi:hypothetical protein
MAYRVVVDKPQKIRALASSASICVADAQLTKSQALVTHASYAAAVSSRILGAFAAYSEPVVEIYYQNLSAIDIALDPYSNNKYFRLEQVGISDAQTLLVAKSIDDLVGAADQLQSLDVLKALTDSFGMGDNAVVLLDIFREFADSAPVIDVQALSLGLNKSETLVTADVTSMSIAKTESDVANIGEQTAVVVSKPFADSAGLSEQIAKSAVFQRVFSDAFVLDDFTDVDAITKDSTAAKNNVIGFSDIQTFVTEKTFEDALSFAEQSVASFIKGLSDTASLTESIQITLASTTSSSVLNTSALNTSPLN